MNHFGYFDKDYVRLGVWVGVSIFRHHSEKHKSCPTPRALDRARHKPLGSGLRSLSGSDSHQNFSLFIVKFLFASVGFFEFA